MWVICNPTTDLRLIIDELEIQFRIKVHMKNVSRCLIEKLTLLIMPSLGQRCGSIKSWISYFWTIVELKKAEAKCTEYKNADGHDGHLVSIHTDEEANFVSSLIRGDGDEQVYWIGLRMNCPTCEFEWTDQSSFNYANWQDGEPNNSEGKGFSKRKIVAFKNVRLSLSRSRKLCPH